MKPCAHTSTCQHRLRHGDAESGCTLKSSQTCNAAKLNRWFYPMAHVVRLIVAKRTAA